MDDNLPDFRGKVIAVYYMSKSLPDVGALEEPTFERQGGRLFLVGRVPRGVGEGDWNAGLMTYIAWDCIAEYTVFLSVEEFHRRMGKSSLPRPIH